MRKNNLYTLVENGTGQLHIFRSYKTDNICYFSEKKSICKIMDSKKNAEFACKSEDYMRMKCAEIGKKVCGTCVSHLYADY